jgi:adenylate cyclase
VIDRHLRLHPDDVRAVYFAAGHWSALGEPDRALALARKALKMAPQDSGVRYNVACVYVSEGLHEEALDLLEENVNAGWGYVAWVEHDPDLEPLRKHPRYCQLMKRLESRSIDEDN